MERFFLWEGMLNLVDGGEVVWMKFYGATGGKTAYNNYWRVYPVQSDGNKISTQPTPLKIAFTLKGDNLKMEFTPCPGFVIDKPDYREVTVNPLEFNEYTQADALFVKFYPLEVSIDMNSNAGKIKSFSASNQVFKTYTR